MPGLSGLDLSKLINDKVHIIFTTAFENYAIDGYEVNALDYLLKPISFTEFLNSITKAYNIIEQKHRSNYIYIKSEYKYLRTNIEDIIYIEGLKDYLKIYLKTEDRPILTLSSIKSIEESLSKDTFIRLHRSFIVNKSYIKVIEKGRVILSDIKKSIIPVGDSYRESFRKSLGLGQKE